MRATVYYAIGVIVGFSVANASHLVALTVLCAVAPVVLAAVDLIARRINRL